MATAIDIYLKQISLTGGIPFAVTLPKAPQSLNMDLMDAQKIHNKLQEGLMIWRPEIYRMHQKHFQNLVACR